MENTENKYIKEAKMLFSNNKDIYIDIISQCRSIIDGESVGEYNSSLTRGELSSVEAPLFFDFIGQFQKSYLPATSLADEEFKNLKDVVETKFKDIIDNLFISGEDSQKNLEIISKYKKNFLEYSISHITYYTNHLFSQTGQYRDYLEGIKQIIKCICKYFKDDDVDPQDLYVLDNVFYNITDDELGYEDFKCFLDKTHPTSVNATQTAYGVGIAKLANKGDLAAIEIHKALSKINIKYAENTIRNSNSNED